MSKLLLIVFTILLAQTVIAQEQDSEQGDLIRLVAALDEPEFYCFDLAGWGQSLQLDSPLQTHTCKTRNGADQMFALDSDQVRVAAYDRCLQVAGSGGVTLPGTAVLARKCSDNPMQKIVFTDEGKLQLSDTDYCLVAGNESIEANGPSHLWRTLSTAKCDSAVDELSTWQVGL